MPLRELNGDQAFAYGALAAGVEMVTSYPGSPSSGTVESLIPEAKKHGIYLEWSSNERVALEMAIGASIAGRRALVCTKGVGMNVMLDPLMALNLTPVKGGLVILLGDDPGGYGSQNDQDTRPLAAMLEMPMMEPATPSEAYEMMLEAYALSEQFTTAVIVRETRSFVQQTETFEFSVEIKKRQASEYRREPLRFVPVPENVVEKHRVLHKTIEALTGWSNDAPYNQIIGQGDKGIVAAGFAFQKLLDVLGHPDGNSVKLLKLAVLNPLPDRLIADFLRSCRKVLVVEENEPVVELQLKAIAHDYGCETKILGKTRQYIHREGELFRWQIQQALQRLLPNFVPARSYLQESESEERPRKESHCGECRYEEVLDILEEAANELGERLVLVGDPGCLVTVADRMDAKYAIGSAVSVADGINKVEPSVRPVALIGDSGFFHTTLPALCNVAHNLSSILIIVLDNGTALTSGSQPHAGVGLNALGEKAPKLSISEISKACGIGWQRKVHLNDRLAVKASLVAGLQQNQLAMVIIKILPS
ncbi:thiamine pyrophosphate-dependent enzyme [bacterium]|nr:thiamine pyrophosphate-dependent enzyme [bacterium]